VILGVILEVILGVIWGVIWERADERASPSWHKLTQASPRKSKKSKKIICIRLATVWAMEFPALYVYGG
jgi:hypothetical protein